MQVKVLALGVHRDILNDDGSFKETEYHAQDEIFDCTWDDVEDLIRDGSVTRFGNGESGQKLGKRESKQISVEETEVVNNAG